MWLLIFLISIARNTIFGIITINVSDMQRLTKQNTYNSKTLYKTIIAVDSFQKYGANIWNRKGNSNRPDKQLGELFLSKGIFLTVMKVVFITSDFKIASNINQPIYART